jgi:hypothetical protein
VCLQARTDGSCCFALDDALNTSQRTAEILDRRPAYGFNIGTYSAITIDDTINILRMANASGKRPAKLVGALGGNSTIPSGGQAFWRDGLYAIVGEVGGKKCFVTKNDTGLQCVTGKDFLAHKARIWSLTARDISRIQAVNTHTGGVIVSPGAGDNKMRLAENSAANQSVAALTIVPSPLSGQWQFRDSNRAAIVLQPDGALGTYPLAAPSVFTLYPVQQPLMEAELASGQSENRYGPAGSTFACNDGDTECNRLHLTQVPERLFYGVGPAQWATIDRKAGVSGSFDCTVTQFGRDPAFGNVKACYRAPIYQGSSAPDGYIKALAQDSQPLPVTTDSIAYGAVNPKDGLWYGLILSAKLLDGRCMFPAGAADPLPNVVKTCWGRLSDDKPAELAGFARCPDVCGFTAPHVVAIVYTGSGGAQRISYKTFTSGARCDARDFGLQAFGQSVTCYARPVLSTVRSLPGFSWCASDAGTCTVDRTGAVTQDRFVATYASPNTKTDIIYKQITGNFKCDPATFDNIDPDFGVKKSCFYKL